MCGFGRRLIISITVFLFTSIKLESIYPKRFTRVQFLRLGELLVFQYHYLNSQCPMRVLNIFANVSSRK